MEIVVLGSGRLGARLTNALAPMGHHVQIIDNDDTKFKNLEESSNVEPIKGNIFNEDLDESIFSRKIDVFIVLTGNDNVNLMVAQTIHKRYPGVARILVRVFDPALAAVYRDLGIEVVCPIDFAVRELLALLKEEA